MLSPWVAIVALVGLGLILQALYLGWQRHRSRSWPQVTGYVSEAWIREETQTRGADDTEWRTSYWPEIRYTYQVAGKTYTGTQIQLGGAEGLAHRRDAEAVLAAYPPGAMVTVHYDPQRPDIAVLEPGKATALGARAALGLLFLGVALWLAFGGR